MSPITPAKCGPACPRPGQKRPFRLALGVERFGSWPLRFPIAGVIVFVLMAALAAIEVMRIEADDSLSQLFRFRQPRVQAIRGGDQRFPSSDTTFWWWSRAKSLMDANRSKNCATRTELQLIEGTRALSRCSRASATEGGHAAGAAVSDPLPEGKAYDALVQKVLSNENLRGKLVSEDGELPLIVLALDPPPPPANGSVNVVTDPQTPSRRTSRARGLKGELSGVR